MSKPQLIVFDCDGVLVDSEIIAARVEADLLAEAGYPIEPHDMAERFAGLTFPEILMRIEQETSIPLQASLIERAKEAVDRRLAREVRAIEGAQRAAAEATAPRCVCSNSSLERIRLTLGRTGLLPLFEPNIFSAEETPSKKPKPAPDVFLFAAESMGAEPRASFAIEDSVHGVAAAVAAGMRVIGFTGASHSFPGHADQLTEAGAETVINRLADLGGVIEALAAWNERV